MYTYVCDKSHFLLFFFIKQLIFRAVIALWMSKMFTNLFENLKSLQADSLLIVVIRCDLVWIDA